MYTCIMSKFAYIYIYVYIYIYIYIYLIYVTSEYVDFYTPVGIMSIMSSELLIITYTSQAGLFLAEGRAAVDIFALEATVPRLDMLHGI